MADKKEYGKPIVHPLGWGDKELAFLIAQGVDNSNAYRSMGYKLKKGNSVPSGFKERIARLKVDTTMGEG